MICLKCVIVFMTCRRQDQIYFNLYLMLKELACYHIWQIWVVFSLLVDETQVPSEHLAYVEWFFKLTLHESNSMRVTMGCTN